MSKQESKQEAIRNAARTVKAHGFSLPVELDKQIAGLENPHYRVAVVGEYQVGKSTLINHVFLGDKPLLTEGRGLCTTAVATDNEYGPVSKLDIFDWADAARTAETLVKTVPNPTEDDVNAATVSSAMDTRADLARKRSRVCIQAPNDALKGFTVIDTPGLDDPSQEMLLDTTWRIIPGADLALLVVPARQLGDRAMNLLRKEIMGTNGISRLMVLVSCKPSDGFDAEQRKDVLDTIKAQLASIGRDNIPVEMYCFDPAIEDIMSDVSEIRLAIRSFLSENAMPGREEKVANLIRMEIEKDLVEVAAKLKTIGTSEVDRAALTAKVEAEVARFKEKAELAFDRFQDEMNALSGDTRRQIELAIDAVFDKFYTDLSVMDDVDKMKQLLERAETTIKSGLQDKISIIGLKLRSEMERIVDRSDMMKCRNAWDVFISDEFKINKPIAAKVPTLVLTTIEVALLNYILPLGWITAIVAKIVAGDGFSPAKWLAKKMILQGVKKYLEEAKPDTINQVMQQVDAGILKTFNDVKTAMEASNKSQVAVIRSALAGASVDNGERAALESAKADFEAILASL